MYQPQTPMIASSPRVRSRRLAEIELGQLILLGEDDEAPGSVGLGIRGDALSRRGEILEGFFRLTGGSVHFEHHGLDTPLAALEIEYELQADLAGAVSQLPEPGDLVVQLPAAHTALVVAGPWGGRSGLLDLGSAIARALPEDAPRTRSLALSWRLVDRLDRSRVLFSRPRGERAAAAPAKRPRGEDSD